MTTRMRSALRVLTVGPTSAERLSEATGWRIETAKEALYNAQNAGYVTAERIYTLTKKGELRQEELAKPMSPKTIKNRRERERRMAESQLDADQTIQMAKRSAANSVFNLGAMNAA